MKPKILVIDIETSPMSALVWGRKDVNISVDHIQNDWKIIAWSAKRLGQRKVEYRDMRVLSEKKILTDLWELLDEADIVVTQNGKSFDIRRINARFLYYDLNPPKPYKQIDTYRLAKKVADFTSFSLEYLSNNLNKTHKKLSHSQFPGMSLWIECIKGNLKAWDEMKRYNINDTLATEELFLKLLSWLPETETLFVTKDERTCRKCGNGPMESQGYGYANNKAYHRWRCLNCGGCQRGSYVK